MWSVVTVVPAGTYEYRFLVDGEWRFSSRHPTVGEAPDLNNIRVFQAAPPSIQQRKAVEEAHAAAHAPETKEGCACCVIS